MTTYHTQVVEGLPGMEDVDRKMGQNLHCHDLYRLYASMKKQKKKKKTPKLLGVSTTKALRGSLRCENRSCIPVRYNFPDPTLSFGNCAKFRSWCCRRHVFQNQDDSHSIK